MPIPKPLTVPVRVRIDRLLLPKGKRIAASQSLKFATWGKQIIERAIREAEKDNGR